MAAGGLPHTALPPERSLYFRDTRSKWKPNAEQLPEGLEDFEPTHKKQGNSLNSILWQQGPLTASDEIPHFPLNLL